MVNIVEIKGVHWTSDSKVSVHATVVYEGGLVDQLIVSKEEGNPYWDLISSKVTLEEIDKMTETLKASRERQHKVEQYRQQEKHIQRRHNDLFSAKIEAFDLPEVINASTQQRAAIRKSKTLTELYGRVAACIISSAQAD